jgi:hypothetical protein
MLAGTALVADPLPSRNDTTPKKPIIAFVKKVAKVDEGRLEARPSV